MLSKELFKIINLLIFSTVFMWSALSVSMDVNEEDIKKENEFQEASFGHQSDFDKNWEAVISRYRNKVHTVKAGDTFWKIAQTFLGNGKYWKKLWALNKDQISNPNKLEIGDKIVFASRSEQNQEATPQMGSPKIRTKTKKGAVQFVSGVKLPPPLKRKPLPKSIPLSLRPFPEFPSREKIDFQEIDEDLQIFEKDSIWMKGFIARNLPQSLGKIVQVKEDKLMFSQGNFVYIQASQPQNLGATFTVARFGKKIKKEDSFIFGTFGYPIYFLGEIKLISEMRSLDRGKHFYKAKINYAITPILKGSHLISHPFQKIDFSTSGPSSQVKAKIIGGSEDSNTRLIFPKTFIYLNKGSLDGLNVGDIFGFNPNYELRGFKKLFEYSKSIGKGKVVHVDEYLATALVISTSQQVFVGDFTGGFLAGSPSIETETQSTQDNFIETDEEETF